MDSQPPRRNILLTYPRTASNLLMRILSLEDQPDVHPCSKGGYFFINAMWQRRTRHNNDIRNLKQWSQTDRADTAETLQRCADALEEYANTAAAAGRSLFFKEHTPWLTDPVSDVRWIHGGDSTNETPWTVKSSCAATQTHSPANETVLPDELLRTFQPTFLIRHPALAFPSNYRTFIDIIGPNAARDEHGQQALEMTLHWSRSLYDWYAQDRPSHRCDDAAVSRPIVLDADDLITSPDVVFRYARLVGLDPSKLRFSWETGKPEQMQNMTKAEIRMRSTLLASTGIVKGKTSAGIDVDREAGKWREEFGEEAGRLVEKWVRAAMPDYEYMRERRLKPERVNGRTHLNSSMYGSVLSFFRRLRDMVQGLTVAGRALLYWSS